MKIVNRISRILALVVVYIICAYGYLTAKGFVFGNGVPVLSNQAYANVSYPQKIEGQLMIGEALIRSVGSDSAPVSMYVFSSMMCSHCGDFHKNIYPKLEEDFISKVGIYYSKDYNYIGSIYDFESGETINRLRRLS